MAFPPRLGAWGSEWYCPETSRTFQKLPGPSGTFGDHFGTFWNLLEHFQDRSRTFRSHQDSFQGHPSYSLSHPMTAKVVGTPRDYPETISVDPGLPQYHSHMFQNHLGLLQSDPDISLNTKNYFCALMKNSINLRNYFRYPYELFCFASTKPSTILVF